MVSYSETGAGLGNTGHIEVNMRLSRETHKGLWGSTEDSVYGWVSKEMVLGGGSAGTEQ